MSSTKNVISLTQKAVFPDVSGGPSQVSDVPAGLAFHDNVRCDPVSVLGVKEAGERDLVDAGLPSGKHSCGGVHPRGRHVTAVVGGHRAHL